MTRFRRLGLAILICGLAAAGTNGAVAAPERFSCVVAAAAGQSGPETISIDIDATARTAWVSTAAGAYAFQRLAVSSVAISGIAGAVSFGVDRSTRRLVWQRYDDDKPDIRYGQCRSAVAASTSGGVSQ